MKTITSGNEISGDFNILVVVSISDSGLRGGDIKGCDINSFEYNLATGRKASLNQVAGHFSLSVNRHAFAGQLLEANSVPVALKGQFNPIMPQAFTVKPVCNTCVAHCLNRAMFKHSGTDPAFHVRPGLAFQNDAFDTAEVQQPGQHQACRP